LVGLNFNPRIQKGTFDLQCTHKSHTSSSHKEKAKRDLYWVAWHRLREQLLKTNQTSAHWKTKNKPKMVIVVLLTATVCSVVFGSILHTLQIGGHWGASIAPAPSLNTGLLFYSLVQFVLNNSIIAWQ